METDTVANIGDGENFGGENATVLPPSDTSNENAPPEKPRESWSAKSQKSVKQPAKGTQDFNVQELRQKGEAKSKKGLNEKGVFTSLSRIFNSALRWRQLDSVTPETSQQSDSRFLNSESTSSSQRDDAIAMQPIGEKAQGLGKKSTTQFSDYTNPGYVHRCSESEEQSADPVMPTGYRSYESGIYSVNSAGNPVPITIEESGPIEELSSSDDDSDEESTSKFRLNSKKQRRFKRPRSLKKLCTAIWRKTYMPQSNFIYYWLLLVTLAVLYNLWLIPLRATFITDLQNPFSGLWLFLDVGCDVLYIADIIIKFRTRVIRKGVYVKDRSALVDVHRKEWSLILDVISILPLDLLFVVVVNPYLRINRVLRLYRAYSWFRLVELRTFWPNLWRGLNLLHAVLVVAHYNACIYFALALATTYGISQYSFAFSWSLNAMFWNGEVTYPEADWQYAYAIYMSLAGFAVTCFAIAYMTSIILAAQAEKLELERAMASTRRFMKQRQLPKDIRQRVDQFYQHTWLNRDFGQLSEDQMLRHLPISVKEEMKMQENWKALKQLPELAHCESHVLRELVIRMTRRIYLPGQTVCKSGEAGSEMFIIGEGVLKMIRERDGNVTVLKEGEVFGEMNIFNLRSNHRRTCDVVSCGYSELFLLATKDVNETLSKYPRVMNLVMQQARRNRAVNAMSEGKQQASAGEKGRSNVHSVSKVQVTMAERSQQQSAFARTLGRDESPDSAIPPSPDRRALSDPDMASFDRVPAREALGMIIRPDIVEKLNNAYQHNLHSLKSSLDGIWQREVACLQQQLAETESERDNNAREVMQLRHRLVKNKAIPPSVREQFGASRTTSDISSTPRKAESTANSKSSLQAKSKKRILLPSVSSDKMTTAQSRKNDTEPCTESGAVQNQTAVQETPLDVYGSLASLTSAT